MNRLIKRTKLAELIDINDSTLRKAISRGQLIASDTKGFIDVRHEGNEAYIVSNCSKRGINIEKLLYSHIKKSNDNTEQKPKELNDNLEYEVLEESNYKVFSQSDLNKIKIRKEIDKIDIDTKLKTLDHARKKAKVLPLDFVTEWSSRNIRGIFGKSINLGDSMINQLCNELGGDIETKLRFKKMFKTGLSEIIDNGVKAQKPEAIQYAKEYAIASKW